MLEQEFNDLAASGFNHIPVTLETFADFDTPLSVYRKLANQPWTYLLESAQGGERFGRYSFIGLAASTRIEVYGRSTLLLSGNRLLERRDYGDPLNFIAEFMNRIKVPPRKNLPRFAGGLVGYFGYDTIRYIEPRLASTDKADTLGTPDILLLLSEELAIVDNLSGKLTLVVYAEPEVPGAYRRARKRLGELLAQLSAAVAPPLEYPSASTPESFGFGEADFKAAVERARQYIVEGDIMQVVLSQRMSKPFSVSPLALYRAIRSLNPSPYLFYYNFDDFHVVGASPEILVRLEEENGERKVTVRPVAGTRPRGSTSAEDISLEKELLGDEKERAEHTQLLDLGRNDIGRISQTGTVNVTESYAIERYSHVMHIVSNVEGVLCPKYNALDVLRACFPAGTLSGAPKLRAMEIIDELEPTKRGLYGGAVGYLGFHGNMDLAITIRTALIKDDTLHVQAGAGIVADSLPENEWQESRNKALAMLRAAQIAEAGLDTQWD